MRISDWSSDVCSSDLKHIMSFNMKVVALSVAMAVSTLGVTGEANAAFRTQGENVMYQLGTCVAEKGQAKCGSLIQKACSVIAKEIGRASCRERVCQYV